MIIKATQKNVGDVLGVHTKGIKFSKAYKGNGTKIRGFLPRIALEDLMDVFHVYINQKNDVVVLTKGRLSIDNKI